MICRTVLLLLIFKSVDVALDEEVTESSTNVTHGHTDATTEDSPGIVKRHMELGWGSKPCGITI